METKERLEFSKNWNNKLLCTCFSTIRPQSLKCVVGEVFDIRIEERFFCYATVVDKKFLSVAKLVIFFQLP